MVAATLVARTLAKAGALLAPKVHELDLHDLLDHPGSQLGRQSGHTGRAQSRGDVAAAVAGAVARCRGGLLVVRGAALLASGARSMPPLLFLAFPCFSLLYLASRWPSLSLPRPCDVPRAVSRAAGILGAELVSTALAELSCAMRSCDGACVVCVLCMGHSEMRGFVDACTSDLVPLIEHVVHFP